MPNACHRRAGLAVKDNAQVILDRPGGDFRAFERREHRRQALAFGLVTGHASGVIDLVAALLELVEGPFLAGQLFELRRFSLAFAQPFFVIGLFLDLDHDRHEAMVLAAQLGALAAVEAGLLDAGPGFVDEPRESHRA